MTTASPAAPCTDCGRACAIDTRRRLLDLARRLRGAAQ